MFLFFSEGGTERRRKKSTETKKMLNENTLLLLSSSSGSLLLLLRPAADSDLVLGDVRRELPVLELGVGAELFEDLVFRFFIRKRKV